MSKTTIVSLLCISAAISSTAAAQAPAAAASVSPAAVPAVAPAPVVVSRPVAETLSNRPGSRISGWYLAPTSGFTTMVGSRGYLFGMRGVLMLDQRFGIGVAGNLLGTDDTRLKDDQVRHIGGYGGLYLQYVLASNRLVHGFIDTTMGSGAWCEQSVNDDCDGQKFAFLEPTANIELNVAKHLRLAAGIGYRFAIAEKSGGHSSQDFSGVVARTSLMFGAF